MADGGNGVDNVTFVGGKAVEQTTEGQKPEEGSDHGNERDAAIKAVREALAKTAAEEGKKAAKEAKEARDRDPLAPRDRGPDGKFVPLPKEHKDQADAEREAAVKKLEKTPGTGVEDPEEEPADPDKVALEKALKARKAAAKAKQEAVRTLERERAEARRIYQQHQAELQKLQVERQKYERWQKDPVRMIEEFGRKPEDLIMELATAGTPEAKARQAQQAREDEIRQLRAWQEREEANRKAFAEHQERQKKVQFRRSVEKQLITTAYSATKGPDGQAEERYPHLATFYKGHEQTLCQEADTIADQYRAATGLEATFEEICEYLEERNARWYKMMSSRPSRANGSQAAAGQMGGNLPQGTNQVRGSAAVSGRGLGPNVSSERRSLGSIQDLDGDERREAAMTAVRAAIAASGGR